MRSTCRSRTAHFDVVIGQEAWCHVPEKPQLISECARVVKPGGVIAFTDILRAARARPMRRWNDCGAR